MTAHRYAVYIVRRHRDLIAPGGKELEKIFDSFEEAAEYACKAFGVPDPSCYVIDGETAFYNLQRNRRFARVEIAIAPSPRST